jgi:hypothetical protein
MEPTPEVSKQIKDLIDAYYSESSAEPLYLKRLVEEHYLLPILIDWAGFFGLRSDGEIFMISNEDKIIVQVESDPRIRRCGISRRKEISNSQEPNTDETFRRH